MTEQITIIGDGELAELLYERLTAFGLSAGLSRDWDTLQHKPALFILADEKPEETDLYAEEEKMRGFGKPWLRVSISDAEGMIGPLVQPRVAGCSLCAYTRFLNASLGRATVEPELPAHERAERRRAGAAEPDIARGHIARLAALEAKRYLDGDTPHPEGRIHLLDLHTLSSSLHAFEPDPLCPMCGELPDDSRERAVIELQPTLKRNPDTYRIKPITEWYDSLLRHAYDAKTGLVSAMYHDLRAPFPTTSVIVPSFAYGNETAGGRGRSLTASATAALLEGMERYCGRVPLGKRTVIHDSYNRLQAEALDPRSAGLYSERQYRQPDFPYEPFDPDMPIDWVWGYNLTKDRSLLVPLSLAYYSANSGENWVSEGSNGCAIGGSLEEAILHGILEVVERDAFLISWYGRLPLRQLDPLSAGDTDLMLMLNQIRALSGYDVRLYAMVMEHGIPGVLAAAKTEWPGRMNLICAAGAHLDPLQAARGAIQEAAGLLEGLQDIFNRERGLLERMFLDSSLVERMEHHVLLYGLPQAEERLSFLLNQRHPPQIFAEAFGRVNERVDLADDVRELVRTIARAGLDVIVVDQTAPEADRMGLRCVKVLIPGMLPMTFGHSLKRLEGLPRLLQVPFELGYTSEPLAYESLHPDPHPFP